MKKLLLMAVLGLAFFAFGRLSAPEPALKPIAGNRTNASLEAPQAGAERIAEAYTRRAQNVPIQAEGRVVQLLPDDRQGSRHQRFLLDTGYGHTVLVAHNIDIAPRITDLQPGDTVEFKGEYVWNAKGGVLHWTHHDPNRRHPDGWLRHDGRTYQ